MNKNMMLIGLGLGGAAIAYLAYRFMQTPSQTYTTTSLNPNSSGLVNVSPYQQYPFVANAPARTDNSNQPWANNGRAQLASIGGPSPDVNMSNAAMIASFTKSASELTKSVSSLWEDLGVSDWFSDGDAEAFNPDVSFDSGFDFAGDFGSDFDMGEYNEGWA